MNEKNDLVVNGCCFGSLEDAEAARQEEKKAGYLEEHMDYDNPENMLLVYKKALENRVFQTPVGWEYLRELQRKLNEFEELGEQIPPVTLYTVFANRVGDDIRVPAPRIQPKAKNKMKRRYLWSVCFNVVLLAAVAAMFAIAITSSNPNILNYEKVLNNRYAAWEQELSEREADVRLRERELLQNE